MERQGYPRGSRGTLGVSGGQRERQECPGGGDHGEFRGSKVLRGKSGVYQGVKGTPGASRGSKGVKGDPPVIHGGQGGC